MSFIENILHKPVAVTIVFTLFVLLGIYCGKKLPVDMYPDVSYPEIMVTTMYGTSAPEEVEQNVTHILESGLSGVTSLKHITSTSMTGYSEILLDFETGTNLDVATNDIRDKIDHVRADLPAGAESPVTTRFNVSYLPVMTLAVQGNHPGTELYRYADKTIAPALEKIDGIASAKIIGGQKSCIQIALTKDTLASYGLTVAQVAQMISRQNLHASAGIIESDRMNYTITATGSYTSLDDIRKTVIAYRTGSSGKVQPVLLRDAADVFRGTKQIKSLAYLDGVQGVMIQLKRQSGKNAVSAVHKVRDAIPQIEAQLPGDVKIVETENSTDLIESTIQEVVSSVVQGAVLAILVLLLFFKNLKSTLVIGFSIPVSIIITLVFMYFSKMSLNLLSLAGLLIGVGMLVDNSIVVLENIYTHASKGEEPLTAAINGTKEMIMPVTASTLTSVCIFLPMIAFGTVLGYVGEAMIDLGYTISVSLVCSLVTSVFLIPVLSAYYLKVKPAVISKFVAQNEQQKAVKRLSMAALDNSYASGVRWVLHHKLVTLGALAVVLAAAVVSLPSRGFIYMPESSQNTVNLALIMPKGTTLEETGTVIREMESIAKQEIKHIKFSNVTVGSDDSLSYSNTAVLSLMLEKPDATAKNKLRAYFDRFPGAKFTFNSGFNLGSTGKYTVNMKSNDLALLRSTAQELKESIKEQAGNLALEVNCSLSEGMPEAHIRLDRESMYDLGVSVDDISNELGGAITGLPAGKFTENGTDTDIIVSLAEKDKEKLSDLNSIFVMNAAGSRIPLSAVAHYENTIAPAQIERNDQTRSATIDVVPRSGVSLNDIQDTVQRIIEKTVPANEGISFSESGDVAEMENQSKGFVVIIIMAMLLVFAVMACQFESYKDPFIIFFTIPLSFIGVAAIYALTGQQISIFSILGMLMLVGVIVNNGIVLVDYTNFLRKGGMNLEEACIESARSRLRPILMSTLTTLISLVPMALFPNKGAEMIQPINLTVLGGLGFGTLMTLFVMPAVYYVFNMRGEAKKQVK